jgi:hypothetical protein
MPFTVGNHGIHLQRQDDGGLRGFFNFAQHGGCRFIPRQCQTGKKTKCFYTSCGYSRDRDVILADPEGGATPEMYMYTGINPRKLRELPVTTCGPLAFAFLDVGSSPDGGALRRLGARLGNLGDESLIHAHRFVLEIRANWKLAAQALASPDLAPGSSFPSDSCMLACSHDLGDTDALIWSVARIGRREQSAWSYGPNALSALNDQRCDVWLLVYPNLVVRQTGAALTCAVLQPASTVSTMLYCDVFLTRSSDGAPEISEVDNGVVEEQIRACASVAEADQIAIAGREDPSPFLPQRKAEAPPPAQLRLSGWRLQQRLVRDLMTAHRYIEHPLYSNSGQSLNAGVNAGPR